MIYLTQGKIKLAKKTLLVLRFINEVLGANVDWDEETQEIKITR